MKSYLEITIISQYRSSEKFNDVQIQKKTNEPFKMYFLEKVLKFLSKIAFLHHNDDKGTKLRLNASKFFFIKMNKLYILVQSVSISLYPMN